MDKNESKFPEDLVNVRVQANTSYQIKRVMELVETEKGLEMMSCSKILKNTGTGPRLRQFATFKDLKHEKKEQERKNKQRKFRKQFWMNGRRKEVDKHGILFQWQRCRRCYGTDRNIRKYYSPKVV